MIKILWVYLPNGKMVFYKKKAKLSVLESAVSSSKHATKL
jgi:hypothetical protein